MCDACARACAICLYMRQVLAFSTRVHNVGCAPFVIGVPSGYQPGCFDTIGNTNPDYVEGDVIRLPEGS